MADMTSVVSRLLARQKVRFVLVGVLNTAFSFGVYALLVRAGLDYKLANLIALLLGIAFSFRTQGKLVFRNSDLRLFLRYVVGWAAIYLLNITVIGLFVRLGANPYVAGLLALPITVVLSYVVQKHIVFRNR